VAARAGQRLTNALSPLATTGAEDAGAGGGVVLIRVNTPCALRAIATLRFLLHTTFFCELA
jgi:hypothetical protein